MEEETRGLRWEDFAGRAGTSYTVAAGGAALQLRLDKAQELSDSGREGGSFRLEFVGPAEPILPQAIYRFAGPDGEQEIFMVPIARTNDGARYEAIFY